MHSSGKYAKYAAIAHSHKTNMPNCLCLMSLFDNCVLQVVHKEASIGVADFHHNRVHYTMRPATIATLRSTQQFWHRAPRRQENPKPHIQLTEYLTHSTGQVSERSMKSSGHSVNHECQVMLLPGNKSYSTE